MNEAERTNETASITATILEEEEARKAALAEETADTVLPDDLLPGVGDDEMTFREGVEKAASQWQWCYLSCLSLKNLIVSLSLFLVLTFKTA